MREKAQKILKELSCYFYASRDHYDQGNFEHDLKLVEVCLKEAYTEMYHAINDGILDNATYIPRKGRRGLKDDWWSGVDDVCDVVTKRLDEVRKKYKIPLLKDKQ